MTLRSKRFAVSVVAIILLASIIYIIPISLKRMQPELHFTQTHTVRKGDTLWGIAQRYAPDTDPRYVVYQIEKVNGVDKLHPGDQIRVPGR